MQKVIVETFQRGYSNDTSTINAYLEKGWTVVSVTSFPKTHDGNCGAIFVIEKPE